MSLLTIAFRTLAKSPFLTLVAILSLALGIGANSAIYSLLDEMLLKALPVQEPDRLVNLANPGPKPGSQSCGSAGGCDEVFSYPMFRDLEAAETGFSGIAAHVEFGANIAHPSQTVSGSGMLVSGSYFPVLGVRPFLGRMLGPEDDQIIGEHFVTVLSHNFWSNRLGSDASVLNQSVVINGHAMTIVGVAAAGFQGTTLGSSPDIFVPLTMRDFMERGFDGSDDRRSYWAYLFGRLEPGVTMEQAESRIQNIYRGIINEVEAPLQDGMSDQTMEQFRAKDIIASDGWRGQSSMHEDVGTPLVLLMTITGFVLLIACANIANLLLAQGAARSQEMAIRGALGASRRQLLSQLLVDSCVLAVLGGMASILVAHWTLRIIGSMLPPEATEALVIGLRPSVVVFAAVLSIGTGLVFGMYPALHSTRPDLMTLVRAGSGQPSGARAAARFRAGLVTAQIGLSMALLVAAGFFIKSLNNVSRVNLGLDPTNVVTFRVSPVLNGYEPEDSYALFEEVQDGLSALPGVTSVSTGRVAVLNGNNWGTDVSVEGFESGPDIDDNSRFNMVGAGYFSTMGIPLLAGREFAVSDADDSPNVAVVNLRFAEKFGLDGINALGKFMSQEDNASELDMEIVGVIGGARYSDVKVEAPPLFFVPYRQQSVGSLTFYVRTTVDPPAVMGGIQEVVRRADANLPVEDLKTLEQQISENVVIDRVITMLSAAFAVLATLLAAIGLYGVIAYSVAQRTREFGVRMALGADGRNVRTMVLWQVGRMTLVGGGFGILAAVGLGRAAQSLLFGMDGTDPLVIAGVAVLLSVVALTAGYGPARRASRVDPMRALRYE